MNIDEYNNDIAIAVCHKLAHTFSVFTGDIQGGVSDEHRQVQQ